MSGRRIELSVIQVASSVLAAVTGAIVASSLGVAGTMIGVAVVSFATTAGTAIYRHYLGRTRERLRSAAAAMGHLGAATAGHTQPDNPRLETSALAGSADRSHAGAAHQHGRRLAPGVSGEQIASSRPYGAPSPLRRTADGPISRGPAYGGTGYGAQAHGGPASGDRIYGSPGAVGPAAGGADGSHAGGGHAGGSQAGGHAGGSQAGGEGAPTGQPGSPVHETWVIPVQVAARLRAEAEPAAAESRPDGAGPADGPGRRGYADSGPAPDGEAGGPADATELDARQRGADGHGSHEPGTARGTGGVATDTQRLGAADAGGMGSGASASGASTDTTAAGHASADGLQGKESPAGATPDGGTPAGGTPAGGTPDGDVPAGDGPSRQKLAAVLDWARTERWPKFAAVAIMIFVLAMGGITILEAATGKPLDALIWGAHNSGTTVGNVVSGPAHRSHHPGPAKPSGTPTPHRTPSHHSPTPTPSTAVPTPTPRTTPPTPTPTPSTPTPSTTPTPAATHSPTPTTS